MELFKLIGTILVNNSEAVEKINETSEKGKQLSTSLGDSISKAGDKVSSIGKKLAPVSVAVGGVLTAGVKGANDFGNGMAKMSTLFDTTTTSVGELSNEFLQLSNKTGLSATELAEAGYQALSAGQDVSQVGQFVETAGNLAKAGFTSTTTAVDVLTTAMNAYGENAGTAAEISNKLVRTQNLGKTTVDELASSMGKIIPTASSMGVNIDNLTSGYVSLTKQGIATAEATTYMNSMFNELGDSGTTLGGVLKDKTGMSFQECMQSGMSLADVLQITKDYANESGTAYNELWSSAEAGKAGLAILNGGVEEFNNTITTMADKTDDVSVALEKLNTPTVQVQKAMNSAKNAGIEVGTALMTSLAPTIEKVCGKVNELVTWFDGLPEPMKTTIATVMAMIAVASPLLLVIGKVVTSIGSVITMGGTLISGISKVIGVVVGINPVFLAVVAVIGLVVAAGVLLYKNWDTIKEKAHELGEKISEKWNSIKEKTQEAWDNVKEKMSNAMDSAKEYVSGKLDAIKQKYEENGGGVKGVVSATMEGVKQYYSVGYDAVNKLTNGRLGDVLNVTKSKMQSVKNTVQEKLDSVKSDFTSKLGSAKDIATSKFESIRSSISDKINSARDVVKNGIDKIRSFFNFSWSLPHLSLPHFSISGSFSLNPPSVPHFGISWYKKAMDNPMLLTEPTAFGMTPDGRIRAGGEAGEEVVSGKDTLLAMISDAVAETVAEKNGALEEVMGKILDLLLEYFPQMANMQLVMDSGTLVGAVAPQMDAALGKMAQRKKRG